MSDAIKIYHNPRCSKSRETLELLKSNGVDPEVVLYLETRLTPRPCVNFCRCWVCPARVS
jgi:arsenate reductase-like glutaredoxin family protein